MSSFPPDREATLQEYRYFPRVPLSRRIGAFAIDFIIIWLIGAIAGTRLFFPIFLIAWLTTRIIIVGKNKGQSLGRYALDMRVVDRTGRTPLLSDLCKREGMLGLETLLALMGLNALSPAQAWPLLLILPLLIDCGFAFGETHWRQAFHDQVAQTLVIQTSRGYSLDLKLKQIVAQLRRSMRQ